MFLALKPLHELLQFSKVNLTLSKYTDSPVFELRYVGLNYYLIRIQFNTTFYFGNNMYTQWY